MRHRTRMAMIGVLVVARLASTGSVAQADETGEGTPPLPSAAPLDAAPPPPPKVDVPAKLRGRLVEVTTVDGKIEGKLFSINDGELEVDLYSGQRVVLDRANVRAARLLHSDADAAAVAGSHPSSSIAPLAPDAPSPWGYSVGIGAGPVWGQRTGRAAPVGTFGVDFALNYRFVYVGTGIAFTWFGGVDSFSTETTIGTLSSGAPWAVGGYLEAGFAQGFFFPYSPTNAIEIRPGVAYGLYAMSSASQTINNCIDCSSSRSFDYNGGHFVHFQLGVYYSEHARESLIHHVFMAKNGGFFGVTASLYEFVLGTAPRIERALTFAFTVGRGR